MIVYLTFVPTDLPLGAGTAACVIEGCLVSALWNVKEESLLEGLGVSQTSVLGSVNGSYPWGSPSPGLTDAGGVEIISSILQIKTLRLREIK